MKAHNLLYILPIAVVAFIMHACDTVAEGDRLIYVKPAEVNRNVLIEDFTGQRCVNCPAASAEIEKLQEEYGDDVVIAVGIHSGPFGHRTTMSSARLPLCTETGDEYYTHWGITSQPGVKINRGAPVYNTAEYGSIVYNALQQHSPLSMAIDLDYNSESRTLAVDVAANTNKNLSGKLQVWIVENGVVAQQSMADGSVNNDYVHQHVFRASLTNDIFGDDITVNEGSEKHAAYSIALDTEWVAENTAIVAFISNDADGVLQVVKKEFEK
ncbi:MAG: Omp28 family outer membrane lipoprotein [Muribaculaceae bacterium]|nr:Omp28 family outer membrane lipoprotein [Muribaculaceae bacterium]